MVEKKKLKRFKVSARSTRWEVYYVAAATTEEALRNVCRDNPAYNQFIVDLPFEKGQAKETATT